MQVAPPSEGEPEDGRKHRHLEWNEARLSLARAQGCMTAKSCAPEAPKRWFEVQKQRLKQGQVDEVLTALSPIKSPATPDANGR